MTATVIIPWRDGCRERRAILNWLRRRYAAQHPTWHVIVAEAGTDEWCKAAAIRAGLTKAKTDLVIVADADSWCNGLSDALKAVDAGAAWARPHRLVYRLTRQATAAVLAGVDPGVDLDVHEKPYRGTGGGAFVVAYRDTLLHVPPDLRFRGWGAEDGAWRDALRELAGREWAGRAPMFHLWHPPQHRAGRHQASPENVRLAKAYVAARGNRQQMQALVSAGDDPVDGAAAPLP